VSAPGGLPRPPRVPCPTLFRPAAALGALRPAARAGPAPRRERRDRDEQEPDWNAASHRTDQPTRILGAGPRSPIKGGDERSTRKDRKSTRLNSSHVKISYAGIC